MTTQSFQLPVSQVTENLRELHRTLTVAARRQYEDQFGDIGGVYGLFNQLANNPMFAWQNKLLSLISDLEQLQRRGAVSALDAAAVRYEANRLINQVEGGDAEFYQQLQEAHTYAPELIIIHAHSRASLAMLPEINPALVAELQPLRSVWRDYRARA